MSDLGRVLPVLFQGFFITLNYSVVELSITQLIEEKN